MDMAELFTYQTIIIFIIVVRKKKKKRRKRRGKARIFHLAREYHQISGTRAAQRAALNPFSNSKLARANATG